MASILVVGATGALRPAAIELAAAGQDVVGIARSAADLAALPVRPVAVDFNDVPVLTSTLPIGPFAAALLYCPTAPVAARQLFAARTDGPVVELLTSAAADPALVGDDVDLTALPTVGSVRVLLGWTAQGGWHAREQLSAAALTALDDGRDRILGWVRPWSGRPRR